MSTDDKKVMAVQPGLAKAFHVDSSDADVEKEPIKVPQDARAARASYWQNEAKK